MKMLKLQKRNKLTKVENKKKKNKEKKISVGTAAGGV
jgi:hypothetical protein